MPFEKASSTPPRGAGPLASAIVFFLVTGLFLGQTGFGQDRREDSPSFLSLGVEGYQNLLSPVLNSKCYMFPSCSEYSIQSISDYGPLLGLMLTVDRLFHEANEDRTSPMIRKGDQLKLYDPPSANIWWK
jgi:putative component of membrane protein insertase Oxa1/YidC/SpoIIIJ protein YidD